FLSGVNARWRTGGNPSRSPIALRIVFSSGGVKAIAIEGSNKAAILIEILAIRTQSCLSSVQKHRAVRLWLLARRAFAFSEDSCQRDGCKNSASTCPIDTARPSVAYFFRRI